MNNKVFACEIENYELENVSKKFRDFLLNNHLLDFVKEGDKVAIKANLVAAANPDSAITTHPILISVLAKLLVEKKARVVIGDSPGGLYNEGYLKPIYNKLKLNELEKIDGISLNHNFNTSTQELDESKIVKKLDCCDWLFDCDYIINFAKLKTHGMMSFSCATKNMFGSVPGIIKPEYHYKYPKTEDFANMLIDIQEFYKPVLHIVDAIDGMEGNGPTAGKPRHVGLVLASNNCYNLDIACCKVIDLDLNQVAYITEAIKRKLCVNNFESLDINMDLKHYIVKDYVKMPRKADVEFAGGKDTLIGKIIRNILITRPKCNKKECIGCKKCFSICPAHAITMKNNLPIIDKKKCIRCFCCQEFCPTGAMFVYKKPLAKLFTKNKKKA